MRFWIYATLLLALGMWGLLWSPGDLSGPDKIVPVVYTQKEFGVTNIVNGCQIIYTAESQEEAEMKARYFGALIEQKHGLGIR